MNNLLTQNSEIMPESGNIILWLTRCITAYFSITTNYIMFKNEQSRTNVKLVTYQDDRINYACSR